MTTDVVKNVRPGGSVSYRLSTRCRLISTADGGLLISEYPLRVVRCNKTLHTLLHTRGNCAEGIRQEGFSPLLEKLADKGFLVRRWPQLPDDACPDVSVVIPVKDRAEELRRCLQSLSELQYPREKLEIIVVDDGSRDNSAEIARQCGVRCIASGGVGRGPAAARNLGARHAKGTLLAFLDSDCTASPGWLRELVAPFLLVSPARPLPPNPDGFCSRGNSSVPHRPGLVAAVGGLVRGRYTRSLLDRYEDTMSSLCLGGQERWSSQGSDGFYLPSCNLLVERSCFLAAGGFNQALHVGEDVDLSYRLRDMGYRIGYLAQGTIYHAHRNRLFSFMARRFDYGTSEAMLRSRHPRRGKQMRIPRFPALLLALACFAAASGVGVAGVLAWLAMAAGLGVDGAQQKRKMEIQAVSSGTVPAGKEASLFQPSLVTLISGRLRTTFSLGYYLSFHMIRYYLPLLLLLAVLSRTIAVLVVVLFIWAVAVDYSVKKPRLRFVSFCLLYLCEQLAYSWGAFIGCCRRIDFSSYRIRINTAPFER